MRVKVGYIIASNKVMLEGQPLGYFYRGQPDNERDSGWRIFSGEETQEYADNPANFAIYHVATILERHPSLREFLACEYPVAFELNRESGEFVDISDEVGPDEEDDSNGEM